MIWPRGSLWRSPEGGGLEPARPDLLSSRGWRREAAEGTDSSQDLAFQGVLSIQFWTLPSWALGARERLMECNKNVLNPLKRKENGA